MELLLLFLMGTFIAAMRTSPSRVTPRNATLLVIAVAVSAFLMSHRVA